MKASPRNNVPSSTEKPSQKSGGCYFFVKKKLNKGNFLFLGKSVKNKFLFTLAAYPDDAGPIVRRPMELPVTIQGLQ